MRSGTKLAILKGIEGLYFLCTNVFVAFCIKYEYIEYSRIPRGVELHDATGLDGLILGSMSPFFFLFAGSMLTYFFVERRWLLLSSPLVLALSIIGQCILHVFGHNTKAESLFGMATLIPLFILNAFLLVLNIKALASFKREENQG